MLCNLPLLIKGIKSSIHLWPHYLEHFFSEQSWHLFLHLFWHIKLWADTQLIIFPPRNNKNLDMRMAERERFMRWIYSTQFLLLSYEVKVQAWAFMTPRATEWPTRTAKWWKDIWDQRACSRTCLQSYLIIFYCRSSIDWLSSECCRTEYQRAQTSHVERPDHPQTCHLLS